MINPDKTALILGAGIAGSGLAYQLAKRNYQVTLLDENNQDEIEIFQNKAAMISPHFMLNTPAMVISPSLPALAMAVLCI